jgi:hypothetical protein
MIVVCRRSIFIYLVALETYLVPTPFAFECMRVVAVAAGDTFGIHFTLQKGVVDIDLVLDLAIGKIEPLCQLCRKIVILELIAGLEVIIVL